MANVYRRVMIGNAALGGVTFTGYAIASTMAVSDGIGIGVEVPRPVGVFAVLTIACSVILAGGAWIARRAAATAAREDVQPVVHDEIGQAFADAMPLFVATVVESLERRIAGHAKEVAVAAGRHSAVLLHELITQDIGEILRDAHRKALVTGQVMQVNASGAAIGRSALRSIPTQYVGTSKDD